MSNYRKLTVKILDQLTEDADVQLRLTPLELIQAVISEFGDDIPSMSRDPAAFNLLRSDGSALAENIPLDQQLGNEQILTFAEKAAPLPAGSEPMPGNYFLREPVSGRVYAIRWSPALVGRSDSRLPDEALLAVNLAGLPQSERVSRRHARIFRQGERIMIECLADNPLRLRTTAGDVNLTPRQTFQLQPNDQIVFEFSQIQLDVLQRSN